jgi:ribosome biogenesis GTPase
MTLSEMGWDAAFAQSFESWSGRSDVQPGRVIVEFNYIYRVAIEGRELEAVASGRLKHQAASRSELPVVGDWVVVRKRQSENHGVIQAVLPRRSKFSRKVAGKVTDEQVVAANVDVVFLVMALDRDFSLRRLERYLLLAHDSDAQPVILLTKPDLAADVAFAVAEVAAVAGDVPFHVLSPKLNQGMEQVAAYLTASVTGTLLGSSGVGKSTIINRLVGYDLRKTREVREEDSKGRHTTTHRQLVTVPGGGLIIDTPGMRELQLWDVGDAVRETFDDIEAVAIECHFSDCQHRGEPRCAVKQAIADGRLPAARVESYLKLQDEVAYLERQQDERQIHEYKRRSKIGSKSLRVRLKEKGR